MNNDNINGTDSEIPRTRSSIARTLLMNTEQNKNTTINTKERPPSPPFPKGFEYLIRRELDIEHAPSTFRRNSSTPSVFQNLNGIRNSPTANAQSPSKLKRKRPSPKQTVPTPPTNKTASIAPFAIRDPYEHSSVIPTMNSPIVHRSHQQNDLYRFDTSHRQHRQHYHQNHQSYSLPIDNSITNSPFSYHKLNINSPAYAQFKIQHDRLSAMSCSSSSASLSSSSSPCSCCHYPSTVELALPQPVSPISSHTSSHSILTRIAGGTSARKTKAIRASPDIYEIPTQRSYPTMSNQPNIPSSSSSPGHSVPLKKRLLHAYTNEQCPSTL